jgi:hypothetical protein
MAEYKRIVLNLKPELYEKVSQAAARLNVNRTAWCIMTISQGVQAGELTTQMATLSQLIEDAKK